MGKLQNGILGNFKGSVGPIMGSSWLGREYIKTRNRQTNKPASSGQLVQRAKFLVLTRFISAIGKLVNLSFKDSSLQITGRNIAFQYHYLNAITGAYPDYALDYTKVLVSRGKLLTVSNPTAGASGNGFVQFKWTDNSGIPMANAADRCVAVVYCPELNKAIYTTEGAHRSAGGYSINAWFFTGKTVETWLAFISADKVDFATSVYTGRLVVV